MLFRSSTYAYWWVRQAITRGIDTKERLIRVPQHGLDTVYKAMRYQKAYMQQHGKVPTLENMANEVGVTVEYMQMLLARNGRHRSLDEVVMDTGTSILDLVPDAASSDRQQDCVEQDEKAAMFAVAMDCLTEGEAYMIQRRYGLMGGEPLSLASIAADDGVSRERIRQRIEAAHIKMRLRLSKARLV